MDEEFKWVAGVIVVVAVLLFGGLFFSDYLSHKEKMECISKRGEFIGKVCLFRDAKPQ